jgi:hypothetical protein
LTDESEGLWLVTSVNYNFFKLLSASVVYQGQANWYPSYRQRENLNEYAATNMALKSISSLEGSSIKQLIPKIPYILRHLH